MKATELRQSILQAAVQGKLVSQNIYDEPASVLLERIQAEKARLVKEGHLKKEKPMTEIPENEIPYDLPQGWVWCRLQEVSLQITSGSREWAKYYSASGAKFLRMGNLSRDSFKLRLSSIQHVKPPKGKEGERTALQKNDILVSITGDVGLLGLVPDDFGEAYINQHVALVRSSNLLSPLFLSYTFLSKLCKEQFNEPQRGIKNSFRLTDLLYMLIPIPPLAEQQRIVSKVNKLMALCDGLEAAGKELDKLEACFADNMPKSILQAAVQGKLVPQNIHDEPASTLLDRIRAEKKQLIRDGKLKKEKLLPPVTEDEIPYGLPEGWEWCRLGDLITQNIGGGTPSKQNSEYWNGDIPWASVKDLSVDVLSTTKDTITTLGLAESSSNLIPSGSIIVCTRMGLGKIVINSIPVAINQDLRALIISPNTMDFKYFVNFYKTLEIRGDGTTVKGITIDELHNILMPAPPLAEQRRIVAKVNELMAICDELKVVRDMPIETRARDAVIIDFPQPKQEKTLLAARGDVGEGLSHEAQQAIDDLFAEDE